MFSLTDGKEGQKNCGKKIFFASLFALFVLFASCFLEAEYFADSPLLNFIKSLSVGVFLYIFIVILPKTLALEPKDNPKFCPTDIILFSLLASYRFIYFYMENITRIPFFLAFVFIFIYSFIFVAVYFLVKHFLKNDYRALIVSLALMIGLSLRCTNIAFAHWNFGVPLFFIILFLLFKNKVQIASFLKTFGGALLIICLLQGVFRGLADIGFFQKDFSLKNNSNMNEEFKITKFPKRDIYIFLFDMYAGKRGLEHIGYDNSDFTKALEDRGFCVYEDIESNYARTVISISSFLNAAYVENISYKTPADAVSNSRLFKMAKQAGYKIYYVNSWPIDFTIQEGVIDEVYNVSNGINMGFVELFVGNTVLSFLIKTNIADDLDKFQAVLAHSEGIIKKNDRKRLVFIHFLMPHMPYVVNEDGKENLPEEYMDDKGKDDEYILNKGRYIGFLRYANKTVLKFLDEIFEKNGEKPLIILMGDHGLRPVDYSIYSKEHMNEVQKNYKYYFNTFLAYYNPDLGQGRSKDVKSLVNFSVNFMNENFGAGLMQLKDEHYYPFVPYTLLPRLQSARAKY